MYVAELYGPLSFGRSFPFTLSFVFSGIVCGIGLFVAHEYA